MRSPSGRLENAKKSKNAARQQKSHSTALSFTTTPVIPPRRGQKKVHIPRKVIVDLISPEANSSEDAWDTAAENSPAEEEKKRGHIDIEDTIASPSPVD